MRVLVDFSGRAGLVCYRGDKGGSNAVDANVISYRSMELSAQEQGAGKWEIQVRPTDLHT